MNFIVNLPPMGGRFSVCLEKLWLCTRVKHLAIKPLERKEPYNGTPYRIS